MFSDVSQKNHPIGNPSVGIGIAKPSFNRNGGEGLEMYEELADKGLD